MALFLVEDGNLVEVLQYVQEIVVAYHRTCPHVQSDVIVLTVGCTLVLYLVRDHVGHHTTYILYGLRHFLPGR